MKTGLILEGGAMRGLFSAGIMDVMMENGIFCDGVIGVSAGAVFGSNYISGQIGRSIRYNLKYCRDKRYGGLYSLLTTGDIYNKNFCYNEIPLKYDPFDFAAFESNPTKFYVVCTDVETGKPVYHQYMGRKDHGFDWIQASASMPLVSRIVTIDGQKLLDGGVADSIPIRKFEQMGYDRNVIILTQPKNYRKSGNSLMPLIRHKYRAYPEFVKTNENRHLVYNDTLDYIFKKEKEGSVFVFRPDEALPVSRVEKDPVKLQAAYDLGRKAGEERLEDLKAFLLTNER